MDSGSDVVSLRRFRLIAIVFVLEPPVIRDPT
jgi:hypothetical protein